MSDTPSNLLLPNNLAAQAQKHITHNEALRMLDGLVQLAVLARDLIAPPASPSEGDRYIVASGATGAWSGWDLNIALWTDGAWLRLPPRVGWRAWVVSEVLLLIYDGNGWIGSTPSALQDLTRIGLGATADANNPFLAQINAALWTALATGAGGTGSLIQSLNKQSSANDLGFLFQTGFSTRALMGLFGTDAFRLAVSADGSSFHDALRADQATGILDQPRLPRFKGYTNYDNYVGVDNWTKIGINVAEYNDQGAFDASASQFVAPVDGTYLFGATLMFRVNASTSARMSGRLVINGTDVLRGSYGESSATHRSEATALWLQSMAILEAGDIVELQGFFRAHDGFLAAEQTSFWGAKLG